MHDSVGGQACSAGGAARTGKCEATKATLEAAASGQPVEQLKALGEEPRLVDLRPTMVRSEGVDPQAIGDSRQ